MSKRINNKIKNGIKSKIVQNRSLPIELLRKHDDVINEYVSKINSDFSKVIMAILIKQNIG